MANNKAAIAIAFLLAFSIAASTILPSLGQVPKSAGDTQTIYAFVNVAPDPVGVGQTVTINFFMASPLLTSQHVQSWTVTQTNPDGTTIERGPFWCDATGGSFTTFVPTVTGEYSFVAHFAETLLSNGVTALAADTNKVTITVQEEPIQLGYFAITPLPNQWWQTPATAENIQEWYKITGPWLGYGTVTFAATGGYNSSGNFNPYTESVMSGHILWTKIWASGGVAGGDAGGTEHSNYWSTSQYQPKYSPVIMNGIMYSQWFPTTKGGNQGQGIVATDIYTGQTLWTINTTNNLNCGMNTQYYQINQYGVIGPFLWTTGSLPAADTGGNLVQSSGTQWNMYQALTGQYMLSIVNGTGPRWTTDEFGGMIGYYINNTAGTERTWPDSTSSLSNSNMVLVNTTGPHLTMFNMTRAIGQVGGSWQPSRNTVREWQYGVMWTKDLPQETDKGEPINQGASGNPTFAINGITNDAIVMTAGFTFGQGMGGQMNGWLVAGAMDANTGAQLWAHNFTAAETDTLAPDSRLNVWIDSGKLMFANMAYADMYAINARTGTKAWTAELRDADGSLPHGYTVFGLTHLPGPDGLIGIMGFGGDIWCLDTADGSQLWQTTTNELFGDPGLETPYGTWPIWVFGSQASDNTFMYIAIGHEYNPPLFHGAQEFALNWTDGSLGWSLLDTSVTSTSIAYGIILSLNAYDNMIYALGKGPTSMTVTAPDVGVTTASPITIKGTVMDVSPGTQALTSPDVTRTKQNEVALRFPNGVPAVSDESQSHWMEYVYQQQPAPTDTTGVSVTLSVIDSNNNYRDIGTATTDTSGTFGFSWTPDIPGDFKVIATFAGSNSYYGSCAETYFTAVEPAQAPAPTETVVPDNTATIMYAAIAIIVAVVVVGAILALLLLRKR